ncbi:MAG TPA: T9SS type A sorting domain-containing protein [Candidatus Acidoferrales bacterium]|nr:T9SS type A sorting domain-containing protein [Candidatus Acidoferrales bacterium]
MSKIFFLLFYFLSSALSAQTSNVSLQTISNYDKWGWGAIVIQNGVITLATVPAIGARVMQYDLDTLQSIMVNPSLLGKTYTPSTSIPWPNFGGYKTWPSPQSNWNSGQWPPPPTLDYGAYTVTDTIRASDSVTVGVASQTEQWYAPGIQFTRKATIYNGTSRVKMEQTIINQGTTDVTWGVWSIIQSVVNHTGKSDNQNFWAYFPINPTSIFGSGGVGMPQGQSRAWKGEVAPGIYGVQFYPDNNKIFADPDKGWIAYTSLSDTVVFARTFPIYDSLQYPDGGARVSVYVSSPSSSSAPAYMEVEVKGPLVSLAAGGGEYTFTENWWAAKVRAPVLDVDSAGAVGERMSYGATTHVISAAYGVFYNGTAKLSFVDRQGNIIAEGQEHPVSPLNEFRLGETVAIPDSASAVEVLIRDGSGTLMGILEKEDISQLLSVVNPKTQAGASNYRLARNYPNPFNGGTVVTFFCPVVTRGSLKIYDILGREVAQLASGRFEAGEHRYNWNPENLASGVYIATFEANGLRLTQKMLYLR